MPTSVHASRAAEHAVQARSEQVEHGLGHCAVDIEELDERCECLGALLTTRAIPVAILAEKRHRHQQRQSGREQEVQQEDPVEIPRSKGQTGGILTAGAQPIRAIAEREAIE